MTLSEICVRRPVFATMLVSACVAFGALSFGGLGVDQYPDVEIPVVTVSTTLRGASPEEVETQVTKIIEDAVSTAEGIDELRSRSYEGLSVVTINFLLDRDRDQATQDVRDKVAAAMRNLPDGVDPPVITRFDTTATPVITLLVSGNRDLREITQIARKNVMERLQGLAGVGQIQLIGGRTRAFEVLLDADALIARGIGVDQVRTAIAQQNVEVPGGRISAGDREDVLRTFARVATARELGEIIVADIPGAPVRLNQVAAVKDGQEEPRSLSRLNARAAVALVVQKQSGTNTVEVVDTIRGRLDQLQADLPTDIRITPIRDQSRFIRRSIHEVETHLVLGALLASVAVLLFMGSFRSTFIAAIAIPSSIVATFAVLRALDYTLNNFTLLALTLSVGIVIDDAIVVLENVYRHIEQGKSPFEAAITGTKEITLAVMATTLSLIVIFLPTAFMEGRVGRFWASFGITTAFAIAISLFISLTLTPMLCSRLLRPSHGKGNALARAAGKLNEKIDNAYASLVRLSLRARWLIVLLAAATIASLVPLLGAVGKDFSPQDDTSEVSVSVTMPEGSSLEASQRTAAEIESLVRQTRGVEEVFATVGGSGDDVTEVTLYVKVVDLDKRDYPLTRTVGELREKLKSYADLRPAVQIIGGLQGGGRNQQLSFSLRGADLDELTRLSSVLMEKMRQERGFVDVDSSAAVRKPEVRVIVDRDQATNLGVRAEQVAASMRTLVGGEIVSKIRDGADQYDVWLRLEENDRASMETLGRLPIAGRSGLARLDAVARLSRDRGPAQIERLNRVRQVDVGANLQNVPLGDAVERVRAIARTVDMPPGYEIVFGGRAKLLEETLRNFLFALGFAFLFMYMILAAQFESFLHPITIMLSLPLSLPFAVISLLLLGDTLNIYSAFGIFMLFGIVKKNGILQVDYTNKLRKDGLERDEAIVLANKTRLRPILMTTLTLIAGMAPIALGKGPGAAARASMANVIIGGQALSLLITLLIVPVAYSLFDDAGAWIGRAFRKKGAIAEEAT